MLSYTDQALYIATNSLSGGAELCSLPVTVDASDYICRTAFKDKTITYVRYNVTVGWGAEMHGKRFAIPHANRLSRYRIPHIHRAFPQHHGQKRV